MNKAFYKNIFRRLNLMLVELNVLNISLKWYDSAVQLEIYPIKVYIQSYLQRFPISIKIVCDTNMVIAYVN